MRQHIGVATFLIGLSVATAAAPTHASDAISTTRDFIEKTRKAITGDTVHTVSLYSTVQNYQVRSHSAIRSMVVTMELSGNDALAYVCKNRPRFREAVLRAVTTYYRASHGAGEITEEEVGKRAGELFARYLKDGWLVKVAARFVPTAASAGREVLKTREKCKEIAS